MTGGARGIGRAIAQAFAREGALVALCDLRPEGKEVAEAIGGVFFRWASRTRGSGSASWRRPPTP